MMTLFEILEEKAKAGKPSKKAGKKGNTKDRGAVKARKSRARIYPTIARALEIGNVGEIFSTKGSDRLYVISKAGWGEKSKGRIAKGFTPGSSTPSSDFLSIKSHAARTILKHRAGSSGRMKQRYGPGAKNKIANSKKAVKKATQSKKK